MIFMQFRNLLGKKILAITGGLAFLAAAQVGYSAPANYANNLPGFIEYLSEHNSDNIMNFTTSDNSKTYKVVAHNKKIVPLLKNAYTATDIDTLAKVTEKAREITVLEKPWGTFVQAASFESEEMGAETNYDAVWVRDSVWAYLALNAESATKPTAKKVLLTLLDYLATPEQTKRMQAFIANPALLDAPDGQMNAVHIRFNANSPDFSDVFIDGKPQPWNHKQNDALGLVLDAAVSAVNAGEIGTSELVGNRLQALVYLTAYLDAAKFYQMPDSGAWEEDARLNTSSVALVTSGLENLQRTLFASNSKKAEEFSKAFSSSAQKLKLATYVSSSNLQRLIDNGYKLIDSQIAAGGESPSYSKQDSRYRTADAALLNLIYPAKLSRLTIAQKEQVMEIVRPLVGDYGMRRYANDNYQCGNYWFHNIKTDVDENSFTERKQLFQSETEAQWFFTSWYAKAWMMLYKETHNPDYFNEAMRFANMSFGQITGSNDGDAIFAADGKRITEFALPESYNFIIGSERLLDIASPITPLNWSKASMTLMLKEFIK
jgi:hypothetical protein